MPNILNVTKEEIIWQLAGSSINAGPQANARIKEYLGEDAKYFAPMAATSSGYIWTSPVTGWIPLGAANESQRKSVESELQALRSRIKDRLSSKPKLAGEILSLPSDLGKYIFFKDENGTVTVIIAGWGFSNARRKVVIPPKSKKETSSVLASKIGFTINGELQPLHSFQITTHGGVPKQCNTDPEGFYHLGEQKPGTTINVYDPASGKNISFDIEDGKSEYILDITRQTKINIRILCDDLPKAGVDATMVYHGRNYSVSTDNQGTASFSVPYFEGEIINVSFEDINESHKCEFPSTNIEIKLKSPVIIIPEPPKIDRKNVSVECSGSDGSLRPDYPLSIEIDGMSMDKLTDKNGKIELGAHKIGTSITVVDGFTGKNPLKHIVDEHGNVIRYVVPTHTIPIPENNLKMIGIDGKPYANRKVVVRQGDKSMILGLDENGIARFNANEFEYGKEMTAQILSPDNSFDKIPFTLEINERDYVIEENETFKNNWWQRMLNVAMVIALIVALIIMGNIFVEHLPLY